MANEEQVATSISPLLQWVATLESCAAIDREQLVKLGEAEKETETCVSELKVSLQSLSPSLDSSKVTWLVSRKVLLIAVPRLAKLQPGNPLILTCVRCILSGYY